MQKIIAKIEKESMNKIISSVALCMTLVMIIYLSWLKDTIDFIELVSRSIYIIIVFISLMISMIILESRLIAGIGDIIIGVIIMVLDNKWAVIFLLVGSILIIDHVNSSLFGCKSPIESNVKENPTLFIGIFIIGFIVGWSFEYLNNNVFHFWIIGDMDSFYPMVEIFGVNVLIILNWTIVGVLLFELFILSLFTSKKIRKDRNPNSNIDICKL